MLSVESTRWPLSCIHFVEAIANNYTTLRIADGRSCHVCGSSNRRLAVSSRSDFLDFPGRANRRHDINRGSYCQPHLDHHAKHGEIHGLWEKLSIQQTKR